MKNQSSRADDCRERIIHDYADLVYRLAFAGTKNRADADDIFQEVFLRYVRKPPLFQSREHEKAWLIRVTINCCKSFWKSPARSHLPLPEEEFPAPEPEREGLEEFLLRLPEDYRVVIHLFYYEDLSTARISRLLGRKESTVRMQLTRARRLLKEYMEGEDCDETQCIL